MEPKAEPQQRLKSMLDQRLEELSRRIEEWLDDAQQTGGTLKQLIDQTRREPLLVDPDVFPAETAAGADSALAVLAELAQDVERSADQAAILTRLVEGAGELAPRVLLFILRNDTLKGWAGRGFDPSFSPKSIECAVSQNTLLSQAVTSAGFVRESPDDRPGNAALSARIGGAAPHEMVAAPMWVRDRVVAVLYADSPGDDPAWYPEALGVMTSLAGLSLETLTTRSKHPRPPRRMEGTASTSGSGRQSAVEGAPHPAGRAASTERPAGPGSHPEPELADEETARGVEDACRFARLLVSEIVLYNAREIEEGRRSKDLYQRLKEDIERSRSMYEQRMAARVEGAVRYFREELVRTLAQGDESAISLPWP